MAFLRALDRFFGTLALAQRYEHLFSLDDASLAARDLTREAVERAFLADLAALEPPAAPRAPVQGIGAPA